MLKKANTPDEIAKTIKVGMQLGEVVASIDPKYGRKAGYFVSCKSITLSPTTTFVPVPSWETGPFFIWFFMPRSGKAQPTGVCFGRKLEETWFSVLEHGITIGGTGEHVIAVAQFDYDEIKMLIKTYGTRLNWK